MRRHLRWVVPLAAGVVAVIALSLLSSAASAAATGGTVTAMSFVSPALALGVPVVAVVAIALTVRGALGTFRDWRHRTGRFTAAERGAELARVDRWTASEAAWREARRLRRSLLEHRVPPTIAVWEVVPQPGEVFFSDVTVEYERYYGQAVAPGGGPRFFFGTPAVMLAGLAVSTMSSASARRSAEAQARDRWREHQHVRLVVSNQRLICLAGGQWLSFPYSAMTAVHPEVAEWALVCEFDGLTAPLRLRGVEAPIAAVMTLFGTHGLDGVANHPGLRRLDVDLASTGAAAGTTTAAPGRPPAVDPPPLTPPA
jgi:hypothetical protein